MSEPGEIPKDILDVAYEAFCDASRSESKGHEIVARAILAERNRCDQIIDAEIEMDLGNGREAQRKIREGEAPLYIPGWSPYDASKEMDE